MCYGELMVELVWHTKTLQQIEGLEQGLVRQHGMTKIGGSSR